MDGEGGRLQKRKTGKEKKGFVLLSRHAAVPLLAWGVGRASADKTVCVVQMLTVEIRRHGHAGSWFKCKC